MSEIKIESMQASYLEAIAQGEAEGFCRHYFPDMIEEILRLRQESSELRRERDAAVADRVQFQEDARIEHDAARVEAREADRLRDELCAAQATVEGLREALAPGLKVWKAHRAVYERAGNKWFDEMPGEWPFHAWPMTMALGRKIEAALSQGSAGQEKANG